MRCLSLLLLMSLSACSHLNRPGWQVELPLCPDAMAFAERDLQATHRFDPGRVVYRQEDGTLCRGI